MKTNSTKPRSTRRSRAGQPEPRLPVEHDEASDQQAPDAPVDPLGAQAQQDAQRGAVDTDRAPVVDRLYNERIRPPSPRKRLR